MEPVRGIGVGVAKELDRGDGTGHSLRVLSIISGIALVNPFYAVFSVFHQLPVDPPL